MLDKYEQFVHTTESGSVINMTHKERLMYFALGLCGETGEAAEKIKKLVRDYDGQVPDEQFYNDLIKELGDVLWYITQLCREVSVISPFPPIRLETVLAKNISKLSLRRERGTIQGSGNSR